ncbi:MAG: UbiA family prenyltransferase [Candidatus Liptonbacteria bacterium]|nr:UbiA family prenyltransferase [Candidatus Liptonbacteria bacterium]
MAKKIIEAINNTKVTFSQWIAVFLGVIFVRILLENLSSPSWTGIIASDAPTIVHYYLFFLGVTLSLILILNFIGKKAIEMEKIALFVLPLTWIAPIIDLVISRGQGFTMGYPFQDSLSGLGGMFAAFFGPTLSSGITPGIKNEIFALMYGSALFVFLSTKKIWRAIAAYFATYAVIFWWGAFPSIIKIAHDWFVANPVIRTTAQFFTESTSASIIARNFLHPTLHLSYLRNAEMLFNGAISQIYFLTIFLLFALYIFLEHRNVGVAVLRNSRPRRLAYYYIMLLGGFLLSGAIFSPATNFNWIDAVSVIVLFLTYYCVWMFAVGLNDLADVEADKISNPGRPLVRGTLAVPDVKSANLFFLISALVGGFLVGHYIFFMVCAALAISYIYSLPPLRLKSIPLVSTFVLSLAALSTVMSGFYTLSIVQGIRSFPMQYAALIIIALTLGLNVKDLKDADGDKRDGTLTLPVLFGEKNGKRIVGTLVACGFLIVPVLFPGPGSLAISAPAAIAAYLLINRRRYAEWTVFLLFYLYAAAAVILSFLG